MAPYLKDKDKEPDAGADEHKPHVAGHFLRTRAPWVGSRHRLRTDAQSHMPHVALFNPAASNACTGSASSTQATEDPATERMI